MKKRIIAAALAAVVTLNLCSLRPKAAEAGVVAAGVMLGGAAWYILDIMTGKHDQLASEIGKFFEGCKVSVDNAIKAIDDHWADGWNVIYNYLTDWTNGYTVNISDDGKVRLKYSQYLELCDLVGNAYADLSLSFDTDIKHIVFKATPDIAIYITSAVSVCPASGGDMVYMPIFYSEDMIYFPNLLPHLRYSEYYGDTIGSYEFESYNVWNQTYNSPTIVGSVFNTRVVCTSDSFLEKYFFYISGNESSITIGSDKYGNHCTLNMTWTSYNGKFFRKLDSFDSSDLNYAILTFEGLPNDFFRSLSGYNSDVALPDIDDLSKDLSPILDKTKDPTLEIDTDPSIATPADAVTVTDIPGTADVTIAQLREKTNVDIDIPSVISTKFPFCIPFDFIRIIGVLCADPVAPVFRIPISTDPENLKGFEGNQTIGELPEDFTPMFEIDEELVLDLSAVPLVQPICYTVFIISFVVLLIFSTNKMINH